MRYTVSKRGGRTIYFEIILSYDPDSETIVLKTDDGELIRYPDSPGPFTKLRSILQQEGAWPSGTATIEAGAFWDKRTRKIHLTEWRGKRFHTNLNPRNHSAAHQQLRTVMVAADAWPAEAG